MPGVHTKAGKAHTYSCEVLLAAGPGATAQPVDWHKAKCVSPEVTCNRLSNTTKSSYVSAGCPVHSPKRRVRRKEPLPTGTARRRQVGYLVNAHADQHSALFPLTQQTHCYSPGAGSLCPRVSPPAPPGRHSLPHPQPQRCARRCRPEPRSGQQPADTSTQWRFYSLPNMWFCW